MCRFIPPAIIAFPFAVLTVHNYMQQVTKISPRFYTKALNQKFGASVTKEIEQQLKQLNDDVAMLEQWKADFSDDAINAWLATRLSTEFPGVLPKQARNPRIEIRDHSIRLACQVQLAGSTCVFSTQLKVALTEHKNVIRVEICNSRLGLIPIDIRPYRKQITQKVQQSQIEMQWADSDENLIAYVRFPQDRKNLRSGLVLKLLELPNGRMTLTGESHPGDMLAQSN